MLPVLLRPRWLAWHAALVVVLVAFGWLGGWQLGSFEHHPRPTGSRAAIPLDTLLPAGDRVQDGDVARRVTAHGRYDAARQLLVPGRERGGRAGYLVVTPLRTPSGVAAVLRGWVPSPSSRAVRAPVGDVAVTGRVQASEPRAASGVDPLEPLPAGQIAYVSSVALLEVWPYAPGDLVDGFLVLDRETPAPAAAPARVAAQAPPGGVSRWRNLAYAVQWWLFAGAAVFFWASVIRRAAQDRSDVARG